MRNSQEHHSVKFSFVLPAWKGRYLAEAVRSILRQDYRNFELIVVDDCSPEPLGEIMKEFRDNRVVYHRNEKNLGGRNLVGQWNRCLQYASGEYVVLATDDDLYEPTFLSAFVPLIEKYPKVELFRARILQTDAHGTIKEIDRCYKEYLTKDEFVYHMLHGMKGGIPHYIFKRQALMAKGGFVDFPKAWASDDATAIMMAGHGVVNSQEHLVRFRWSSINISSDSKCAPEKVEARLKLGQWLKDNLQPIERDTEWNRFLARHVDDYLSLYNKLTLISTMKHLPLAQKMSCLRIIIKRSELTTKDKLSIIRRTLW